MTRWRVVVVVVDVDVNADIAETIAVTKECDSVVRG